VTHVHDSANKESVIILKGIINTEWKTTYEITPDVSFYDLSGSRMVEDVLDTFLNFVYEGLRQS
jgi:hypothetical protein